MNYKIIVNLKYQKMIFNIDTGKEITKFPHKEKFDLWSNRLSQEEFDAIRNLLDGKINENEVHTSN